MGLTKRLLDLNIRPGKGFKTVIAEARKQIKAIDKISFKALDRFGAIIRQDARKAIGSPTKPQKRIRRVRVNGQQISVYTPEKMPRSPGKPPIARHQDRNMGVRKILYITDPRGKDVKIGFGDVDFKMGTKWGAELHEFGGTFTARVKYVPKLVTAKQITKRKLKRGGVRELNKMSHTQVGVVSSISGKPMNFKMPKRPTMAPALARHRNKMTKIWIDYYKARFG
jgi:hypothetical protein